VKIERFEVRGLAQYSYIISDAGSAVVIDPIRDVDRYLTYAKSESLRITHVVETHIHADFAAGSIALVETTGAELALSAYDDGELYRYAMPHRSLADGDSIAIGSLHLQAMHTPGHTPEHLAFLLFDSTAKPVAMFSGDFLFSGSLGRPDLLGNAAKVGLAHDLYRSVRKLAQLPDHLVVYPGHGAGSLCGSGIGGHADTTLAIERATNPFFGYDEAQFVEKILASVPPLPTYYPRMKALNAHGAPSLHGLPGEPLSPSQIEAMRATVTLLDVRSAHDFARAHLAGAINIGAGPSLSLWAGWILDPERPIVLISEDGDLDEAGRSLLRVGLDKIAGHLQHGMAAWIASGRSVSQTAQTSVTAASRELGEAVVIDVRDDNERATGSIPGSLHVPLGNLPQSLSTLPRDKSMRTVCGSGYRSSVAASLLEAAGFKDVSSIDGGMAAWTLSSLPLASLPLARPPLD
jgi:hydroxyacylglutathione hydrolase